MKKILYSFLFILSTPAFSQSPISIFSSDMPGVDDTFRLSVKNGPDSIDITNTGANWTWDYSFLDPDEQKVDTFVNPFLTDPQYYINFNNPFDQNHYASLAQPISPPPSFDANFQIEDVYYFYKKTSSKYTQVGFGAKLNGISISQQYNPVDVIYEFPLDFGNTSNSTSSFNYDFPNNDDYYGRTTERTNTVDGWGTLITPFGTFQTLRIKSEMKITDTLYLDSLNFGFNIPRPTQFEYKWLAKNNGIPVLQINTQETFNNEVISDIVYRDSVRIDIVSVKEGLSVVDNFSIYPNPNTGSFMVQVDKFPGSEITVYDVYGKIIYRQQQPGGWYEVSLQIPNGIYFIKAGSHSKKFIVNN